MQHHVTSSRTRLIGGVWIVATLLALSSRIVGPFAQAPKNAVSIEIPQWARGVVCAEGPRLVKPSADGANLLLQCQGPPSELLKCDGKEVEPLEMRRSEVCRLGRLPLLEASQVVVRNPVNLATTVEWLEMTSTGVATVATRRELSDKFQIAVADAPGRLIRFSRDGASPVSVDARRLLSDKDWSLPEAVSGGEVIWSTGQAEVMPIRYQFSGASSWTAEVFGGSVDSRWGLPPGSYLAVPEYDGGLKGEAVPFNIASGKSMVLRLPVEGVGAVRVAAAAEVCGDAPELAIARITYPSPVARIGERPLSLAATPGCTWLVSGLPPGRYEVSLRTSLGSAGIQEVTVLPQAVTTITMASPVVTVSGKVSYNGQPVTDAMISWSRQGTSLLPEARTDSNGEYSIKLDQPGQYSARLDAPLLKTNRRVTLHEGENTEDWSLSGGALDIIVRGWDQSSDAVVSFSAVRQSSSVVLKPGQEPRIRRAGLAFEDYSVSVRQEQPGRFLSATRRVSLDAAHPELVVALDLKVRTADVIVTDETGHFVQGASIRVTRATVSEPEPGHFFLDGIQQGTPIRVIPPSGFVPICRTMTDGETVAVSVSKGRRVVIELPVGMESLTLRDGSLLGIADSDCPVPLVDFRSQRVQTEMGQPTRLALDGFPPIEQLSLSINGRIHTVSVPLSGSTVVRLFPQ